MSGPQIGAYGGTFDPIHIGHVEVARAVTAHFQLHELLIVPAFRPPHKELSSISDAYHRYAMTVLATDDDERIKVSAIELEAPDKPYTFETVARLKELYGPDAQLYFIMGSDSFSELDTWREPLRVLSMASIIVAARPGSEISTDHLPAGFASRIVDLRKNGGEALLANRGEQGSLVFLTDFVRRDVSSTEIRDRARANKPIGGLVPESVARYIKKYDLYRR
jgi:nicotinate-nucleotide adenylyltransferase